MFWWNGFVNSPLWSHPLHYQTGQRRLTTLCFSWGLACGCMCSAVSAFPEAAGLLAPTRTGPSGKVASVSVGCSTKNLQYEQITTNQQMISFKTGRVSLFVCFTIACLWHWRSRHFCLFLLLPPNFGLSMQKSQVPQSRLQRQALHSPHDRRFRFLCH